MINAYRMLSYAKALSKLVPKEDSFLWIRQLSAMASKARQVEVCKELLESCHERKMPEHHSIPCLTGTESQSERHRHKLRKGRHRKLPGVIIARRVG